MIFKKIAFTLLSITLGKNIKIRTGVSLAGDPLLWWGEVSSLLWWPVQTACSTLQNKTLLIQYCFLGNCQNIIQIPNQCICHQIIKIFIVSVYLVTTKDWWFLVHFLFLGKNFAKNFLVNRKHSLELQEEREKQY